MSWNYRIVKRVYPDHVVDGKPYEDFGLYEVYYDENGVPDKLLSVPRQIVCDDMDGITWTYEKFGEAIRKPVLNYEDIGSDE